MKINGYEIKPHANLNSADLNSADLRHADLRGANLRYVDLRRANLKDANLNSADLNSADLRHADLRGADLRYTDLNSANLRGADLRGANIDFSVFPLWCGSFDIIVDDNILEQLLTHIQRLDISNCSNVNKILVRKIPKRVENKLKMRQEI